MKHLSTHSEVLPGHIMDNMKLKSPTRKVKKCFVEKIRRERINTALEQLKALMLQTTNVSEDNCEKMEKADILEMTVKYLQKVQTQQKPHHSHRSHAPNTTRTDVVIEQYRAGYTQSMNAVSHHMALGGASQISPGCAERLLSHLQHSAPPLPAVATTAAFGSPVPRIPSNSVSTYHVQGRSVRHTTSAFAAYHKTSSLPYTAKAGRKRYVDKNSNIEKMDVCKIEIPEDKSCHKYCSSDLLIKQENVHSPNTDSDDLEVPSVLNLVAKHDSSVWRPW